MRSARFLAVCLNPTLQKTLFFDSIKRDSVNRTAVHHLDASGKGVNVARVLTQLGRKATHLTQLGGALRPLFLDLCAQDGLDVEWAESGSGIRFCYTAVDRSDRSVTEFVEESVPVAAGTEERVLSRFESLLPEIGVLIVSGTKAAGFSDRIVPSLVRSAKERGVLVALDLRGPDLLKSLPFAPDIVKPNLSEFLSTYLPGERADDPSPALKDKVASAASDVARGSGSLVVLTRGAGSVWTHDGRSFREFAIATVPPVNTTGSGDAFTAGFVAAYAEGAGLETAVAEGARCGALNAALARPGVIR